MADKPAENKPDDKDKEKAAENKPEELDAKGKRLAEGNPLELEKALANATPTERQALESAKKEFDERHSGGSKLTLAGVPGGAFSIDGSGFGDTPGTVQVGGVLVPTTRWSDHTIRGTLPANVKPGDMTVTTSSGATRKGTFGASKESGQQSGGSGQSGQGSQSGSGQQSK